LKIRSYTVMIDHIINHDNMNHSSGKSQIARNKRPEPKSLEISILVWDRHTHVMRLGW